MVKVIAWVCAIAACLAFGVSRWHHHYSPTRHAGSLLELINDNPQAPDETEAEYLAKQQDQVFTYDLRPKQVISRAWHGSARNSWVKNEDAKLNSAKYDVEAGLLTVDAETDAIRIGSIKLGGEPVYVSLKDFTAPFRLQAELRIAPPDFRAIADKAYWRLVFRPDNLRRYSKKGRGYDGDYLDAPVKFKTLELMVDDKVLLSLVPQPIPDVAPQKARP